MAIIIPSKNIYEINNPKVRDNIIDNVSIDNTIVSQNNEYDTVVWNEEYTRTVVEHNTIEDFQVRSYSTSTDPNNPNYNVNYVYVGVKPYYYENIRVEIPILSINKYIDSIKDLTDKEGNPNIKYTVFGKIKKGTSVVKLSVFGGNATIEEISTPIYTEESEIQTLSLPKVFEYQADLHGLTQPTAKVEITDIGNFGVEKFVKDSKNDNWNQDLTFLTQIVFTKFKGFSYTPTLGSKEITETAEVEMYEVSHIEITIYGNTIGIDLNNGSVSYIKDENGNIVQGKGNKPHSLSGNELLQDSGKVGETILTKHLAKNVLEQYKKGKETATLLCSIGEYYDILYPKIIENLSYNGKNFIQTNKLTIKNTITNPHEQGYSATFNFDFENIEMVGNETSIIIETPIDPDIAKSVLYFNLPDYVTLESNPVVVTKSKTLITIKTQNKQQMIDFAREHYSTLVTDYCYKVEQYRYTEAPISVYKLNVLDSSFNIITELYNEIFSEPKDFTFSFDKIENYKYLELVFTTTVSEDKCIIVYDVGNLPNGKHDLEVKVFNTTNGNFKVAIKEIKYVAISTKDLSLPMVFRLHDEVIPMVYSANGVDVPMSRYQYGSPKVFEVTGSNIIYDGAVWQELTLQELL